MTRAANVQAFINRHARHFEQVHLATGIPPSVIVAQSALETGWGSSTLYREGNNLFAFRYYARHPYFVQLSGGKYAGYDSFDDSAEDYIWLMTRAEWSNPDQRPRFREWAGYTAVIEAGWYCGRVELPSGINSFQVRGGDNHPPNAVLVHGIGRHDLFQRFLARARPNVAKYRTHSTMLRHELVRSTYFIAVYARVDHDLVCRGKRL